MASKKRRRTEPAPGWAWMLFGLSIGLSVALIVYLKSDGLRVPGAISESYSLTEPAESTGRSEASPRQQSAAATNDLPAESTGETELSFYSELRDSEVIVPENEFDFDTGSETPQKTTIQAGSFPTIEGADRQKASIALLGIESQIERAPVNQRIYYRVMIGPLSERGEINRIRRRLRDEGIDTVSHELPN